MLFWADKHLKEQLILLLSIFSHELINILKWKLFLLYPL